MSFALEDAFCDIIRKARYGLGLEIVAVASKTGLSTGRIIALEKCEGVPTEEEVHSLARALHLNPRALWEIVRGWRPEPIAEYGSYAVETFTFEPMNSNGYLVTGPDIDGALIVDPGGSPKAIIERIREQGGIHAVLVTHTHQDHVAALPHIVEAYPRVPVVMHAEGRFAVPEGTNVLAVAEDAAMRIGNLSVEASLSPGHSDDGLIFRLGPIVFTGDTLFAGSLGRSQAGPATYDTLLQSGRRLLELPPQLVLLPGHGPATTVDLERRHNAFLAEE